MGQVPTEIPNAAKTGLPEGGSFDGTMENVNLSNGNVNVRLPLLHLPGVAGFDFNLSLLIDSRVITLGGDQAPQHQSDGTTQYTPPHPWTSPVGGKAFAGGRLSIPTLQWVGANMSFFIGPGANGCGYDCPPGADTGGAVYGTVSCPAGFVFSDASGAMHGFKNFPDCTFIQPAYIINLDDTRDGSLYRLDTHNRHDVIVTDQSGIQYHFDLDRTPVPNIPIKMNDLNGNQITFSASVDSNYNQTITIVDTQNRTITITSNDIQYKDSNGNDTHITAVSSVGPNLAPFSVNWGSCHSGQTDQTPQLGTSQYSGATRWTLQMPTQETYLLDYDGMFELTKITYPSGGYSRYDYQNTQTSFSDEYWACGYEQRQLAHRSICADTSGNCSQSQESVTTYTPSLLNNVGQNLGGSNGSMDVQDAAGNHTVHNFISVPADAYPGAAPVESEVTYKDSTGAPLRVVRSEYQLPSSPNGICPSSPLPSKITTTLSDGNVSSYVELEYQALSLRTENPPTQQCQGLSMSSNVTARREYGFDGGLVRSTTQQWSSGSPEGSHILDRLTSRTTANAGSSFVSIRGWNFDSAGNLAGETTGGTGAADATTTYIRDGFGRLTSTTDPNHNGTTYGYVPSWNGNNCVPAISAFPTSVTNTLQQTTNNTYNPCTGTLHSSTEPNHQTTTFGYDASMRRTDVLLPDTGGSHTVYSPSGGTVITNTTQLTASESRTTTETHDGLGRLVDATLFAPEGLITTTTSYDSRGLVQSRTVPYIGSNPGVGTSFSYDALGRKQYECDSHNGSGLLCNPQNAYRRWEYSGATVTAFDESGRPSKQKFDALGRLTDVWSADESNSPTVHTAYEYNSLDGLTKVVQDGNANEAQRIRTFTYNGLGQLITSFNPETGTVCYGNMSSGSCTGAYDGNGNLQAKTDNRGVLAEYTYDGLNRITKKATSGGGFSRRSSCYLYDDAAVTNSIGRLAREWTQSGGCENDIPSTAPTWKKIAQYDEMGRIKQEYQCPHAPCKELGTNGSQPVRLDFAYSYDLAGNLSKSTNGAPDFASHQFQLTYGRDIANRLTSILSNETAFDRYLLVNSQYNQFGLTSTSRDVDPVNPTVALIRETRAYDTYGRLTSMRAYANPRSATASNAAVQGTIYVGNFATLSVQVAGCDASCGTATVSLDGGPDQTVTLDSNGTGNVQVGVPLSAGTHSVQVSYAGNATKLPSTSTSSFTVQASPAASTSIVAALSSNPVLKTGSTTPLVLVSCTTACGTVSIAMTNGSVRPSVILQQVTVAADGTVPTTAIPASQLTGSSLTVSYSGDATHAPASTTIPFTTSATVPPYNVVIWPSPEGLSKTGYADIQSQVGSSASTSDVFVFSTDNAIYDGGHFSATGYGHKAYLGPTVIGRHILTARYATSANQATATASIIFKTVPDESLPYASLTESLSATTIKTTDPLPIVFVSSPVPIISEWAIYIDGNFICWGNDTAGTNIRATLSTVSANTLSVGTHVVSFEYGGNLTYRPTHVETTLTVVNP